MNTLILGASSGIGAACAKKLGTKGQRLFLVARSGEKMEKLRKELPAETICIPYDLQNIEGIRESIFEVIRETGSKLDAMIYSAGVDSNTPIKVSGVKEAESVMRINCWAFLETAKCFCLPKYSVDHARILAISSIASRLCDKGQGIYSASKAALNALVQTMAKEYVRRGILVNAILPAGVMTPMAARKMGMSEEEIESGEVDRVIANLESEVFTVAPDDPQPFGMIPPGSIADIAEHLVSEQNKYITGALIPVSAGRF